MVNSHILSFIQCITVSEINLGSQFYVRDLVHLDSFSEFKSLIHWSSFKTDSSFKSDKSILWSISFTNQCCLVVHHVNVVVWVCHHSSWDLNELFQKTDSPIIIQNVIPHSALAKVNIIVDQFYKSMFFLVVHHVNVDVRVRCVPLIVFVPDKPIFKAKSKKNHSENWFLQALHCLWFKHITPFVLLPKQLVTYNPLI